MVKIKEETFNRLFNAFILIGMLVSVIIASAFKFQDPEANRWMLGISAFGTVMGVISTVLSANGIIWNFVFGLIDVLIYSYGLYMTGTTSTLLLHVFYIVPMEFIGFFQWRKKGAHGTTQVKAEKLSTKLWLRFSILFAGVLAIAFGISLFSAAGLSGGLSAMDFSEVNVAKVFLDATVTASNIVALVLMSMAYMEQWYLWTLVNLSSVVLWSITLAQDPSSGYTVVFLVKYIFYLINGLNAIRIWKRLSSTVVKDA